VPKRHHSSSGKPASHGRSAVPSNAPTRTGIAVNVRQQPRNCPVAPEEQARPGRRDGSGSNPQDHAQGGIGHTAPGPCWPPAPPKVASNVFGITSVAALHGDFLGSRMFVMVRPPGDAIEEKPAAPLSKVEEPCGAITDVIESGVMRGEIDPAPHLRRAGKLITAEPRTHAGRVAPAGCGPSMTILASVTGERGRRGGRGRHRPLGFDAPTTESRGRPGRRPRQSRNGKEDRHRRPARDERVVDAQHGEARMRKPATWGPRNMPLIGLDRRSDARPSIGGRSPPCRKADDTGSNTHGRLSRGTGPCRRCRLGRSRSSNRVLLAPEGTRGVGKSPPLELHDNSSSCTPFSSSGHPVHIAVEDGGTDTRRRQSCRPARRPSFISGLVS